MTDSSPRAHASTHRVEELVRLVVSGHVRIPTFQRGLCWRATDVIELFESINIGYPIGSLLFHRKPAPAASLQIGPLQIHAPETNAALWVIDGQQRLVALAAACGRPAPMPRRPDDCWVVYYDPDGRHFHAPPDDGQVPDTWVPLNAMLDASVLHQWVSAWPHARKATLRKEIFEASSRLREYTVPTYTVDTNDEAYLRGILLRVNKSGRPHDWQEIHDALYGASDASTEPTRLSDLGDALMLVGMGRPDEHELLRCLIAFEGHDVTQGLNDLRRSDSSFLAGTAALALSTLRRVLHFLRADAKIPHLRCLPWSTPLTILTRFFRLHPEPSARSRELLGRWLWRSIAAARSYDDRAFQRRGVTDISEHDEEGSVQNLLALLPKQPPPPFNLPERFDARRGESRIALLGLGSLGPRELETGRPLEIGRMIEDWNLDGEPDAKQAKFRRIVGDDVKLASSPANRVLLPGKGLALGEILAAIQQSDGPFGEQVKASLASHAITSAGLSALRLGQHETFLADRAALLEQQCNHHITSMADWTGNDRPSLDYIIHQYMGASHGEAV